jgi:hypothetical protein
VELAAGEQPICVSKLTITDTCWFNTAYTYIACTFVGGANIYCCIFLCVCICEVRDVSCESERGVVRKQAIAHGCSK